MKNTPTAVTGEGNAPRSYDILDRVYNRAVREAKAASVRFGQTRVGIYRRGLSYIISVCVVDDSVLVGQFQAGERV